MFPLSKTASHPAGHEEVFLGRYARLRAWALQLTAGDRERAEDLVHDAFVQFNLTQPDLNGISNLDGYLYRMLRNLHLSQVRRSMREQHRNLSIIDYDSAEIGLRTSDPRHQIRLQDELRLVCHYGCIRKETSKAGSVLILRFLHGYYPSEIARVMRSTRPAAEERLRAARNEARQHLKDPNSLQFMRGTSVRKDQFIPMGFARPTVDLLSELRQTIFDSRQGTCLTLSTLKELYSGSGVSSIDQLTLAHITSCSQCLDSVNRLLNLPPLAERFPIDTMGTDRDSSGTGGGDGDGTSGGISGSELQRCRKRVKEVLEHRPSELCVSVNGYLVAAQNVGSEISEQTLTLNVAEKIDFVEIFGEQDIRLLLLNVDDVPPEEVYSHSVRVDLSDDRTLEATLRFSDPWPTLQVLYSDPQISTEAVATPVDLKSAPDRIQKTSSTLSAAKQTEADGGRWGFENPLVRAWRWFSELHFVWRPATVTTILSLFLIAAVFFVRLHVPTVSAAELLHRAVIAENMVAANHQTALHSTLTLEERSLSDAKGLGNVVSRRRIEIWQSASQGIKLRRVYDEQNSLIAGEWSRNDGSSTVYVRGMTPQPRTAPDVSPRAILETGEIWRLDSSAQHFHALLSDPAAVSVKESSNTYVLTLQNGETMGGSKLVGATLQLNKTDLHATQQTLRLQRDGATTEYRFIETHFSVDPADGLTPSLLQPEPELLGAKDGNSTLLRTSSAEPLSKAGTLPTEVIASRELEIEVTYILDRIKANLGEQVNMVRTAGGTLHVEALVESEGRKEEILRALAPLNNNRAVKIDVRTVSEAVKRQPSSIKSKNGVVQEVEVANARIPADVELRSYFSMRLVGSEAIDREIDRQTVRVLNHSRQALLHASALKRLVEQFPPEEITSLDAETRGKWLAMIRQHVKSYQREVAALRRELSAVFQRHAVGSERTGAEANVRRFAASLLQLSYANDEVVRSAFTISADGGSTAALKSDRFWRSLSTAENLAEALLTEYQK
ncbi:MAG TPA: RNA polymerase sigma factor [Pyrinomonadaceae bacterium]